MITGFNTDIEFAGVTYHVQTEDKGRSRPIILSLVYEGGTILASKRARYDDLLNGDFDEKVLAERLQKQHRLICAAISAGRINDLRRMGDRDAPAEEHATAPTAAGGAEAPDDVESPIPKPPLESWTKPRARENEIVTVTEGVSIVEEFLLPDDAVEIVSEMVGRERPAHDNLSVEFIGDTKMHGGQRKSFSLMVCRGTARKVVAGAEVMVKILGSSFRPVIFHASTDANGIANMDVDLPRFNSGRAALLVRAMSNGEEVELRRVVEYG